MRATNRSGLAGGSAAGYWSLMLVLGWGLTLGKMAWGNNTQAAPELGEAPAVQTPAAEWPADHEAVLAMQGFRKPAGWDVALFAAEPDVANPVALTVDHRGRVFVCESFRQDRGVTDNRKHDRTWLLADLAAQTVQDRIEYHRRLLGTAADQYTVYDDQIRLLEDTDGDGRADRHSIFADGFHQLEEGTGAGILVRGHQAYYTCIPRLWLLSDSDDDGQAETRQALHDGFGVRVAFRGHDLHGLTIGPDGRLYFSIGDRGYNVMTPTGRLHDAESGAVFRCELDGSQLEVFATGLRNPQELAFDDYGYLFTGDNNSDSGDQARWVNVMEGGDSGWRMMYQYLPDRGPFNREQIWRPYSADTPAYIVPPIANIGDGPSGLTCYPGTGLSGDFDNCFFMVDFRGGASNSGIRLIRTQPQGAFWSVERSEQPIWNILATDAEFGPDGSLWVSDWLNGWTGEGQGRIYRFFDRDQQQQAAVREVQAVLAEGFGELSPQRLASLLRHADRRLRWEAQWELAQRGHIEAFAQLLQETSAGTLPRMHAVWGLGQAGRLHAELREQVAHSLLPALEDADGNIRAAAAGVAGDLRLKRSGNRLVGLVGDSQPRVQYAACLAIGKLQLASGLLPTLAMLEANHDADPGLRHAGIMALCGIGSGHPQRLAELAGHPSESVRVAAVVALRKLQHPLVASFLGDAAAAVQLEAARAIHDVPELQGELPRLASLLPELVGATAPPAEPLLHRVLNANFRLGTPEAAQAIAQLAGQPQHTEAMRMEAVAMLASWSEPGQLDRITNRYAPLPPRPSAPAAQAFNAHLANIVVGSDRLLDATIAAAVELEVQDMAELLRQWASDANRDVQLRSHALAGLVKLRGGESLELVSRLANDPQPAVRSQALDALAQLDQPAAIVALRRAVASDVASERQQAWDTLANIELPAATELIEQGLAEYLAGQQPPETWLNIIEASEGRVSSESIAALNQFEEQLIEEDPLQAYRDCLSGGDPGQGRELFFTRTELSCVRCHKVAGTGGEVGPDLSQIGKSKDARYLLESIVDPDAKIAENFETVVLLTDDGQVHSGILRSEAAGVIELLDAQGNLVQVEAETVESRKHGASSMPADLLKHLTRRELRDLVAYLASLTSATAGAAAEPL